MKKVLVLAIVVSVMWISSAEVGAVDYYVSPSGSDSDPGTSEQPFETIQKAADVVVAGDTVIVKDGVYTDTDQDGHVVELRADGNAANWITFKAEHHGGAIIDGLENGTHHNVVGWFLYYASYIKLENFDVTNCRTGIYFRSSHDIDVYRCIMHDIGRERIWPTCPVDSDGPYAGTTGTGDSYNIMQDSCLLYNIGRGHRTDCCIPDYKYDHGIYIVGTNYTVKNCIIYNMYSGQAVKVAPAVYGGEGFNTIVTNCVFAHDANDGFERGCYDWGVGHIWMINSNEDVLVQNNVFYNPPGNYSMKSASWANLSKVIYRNNVGSGELCKIAPKSYGEIIASNNIVSLPLDAFGMTDPENNDFTLTSSATYLIDEGIAEDVPDYDYAGTPRPYGNGYDIGAYEFEGVAPSLIDQTGWSLLYVDSEETSHGAGESGAAVNSFDGDPDTIWHTEWYLSDPPHPHEIQIDLGGFYDICGFRQLPRQGEYPNGMIKDYEFYVSNNTDDWGTAVASGTFVGDQTEKTVSFDCKLGRCVRLIALSEVNDGPWTSMAELNVLVVQPDTDINNDGKVNIEDFAVMATWWNDDGGCVEPDWCGGADFDMSGTVDMLDFTYFAENWLRQVD